MRGQVTSRELSRFGRIAARSRAQPFRSDRGKWRKNGAEFDGSWGSGRGQVTIDTIDELMQALVLNAAGFRLATVPTPTAAAECLIRVRVAGICGTDLQLLEGYADFSGIPGHEFVGIVEDAAPEDNKWIGKRVVGEINVGCGRCAWCREGVKEHCPDRTVVGIKGRQGAFAEYISLPAANLHAVPDTVDDRAAVFVEPLAAACRILDQIAIDPDSRVAVIGDGRLGLLIAQVLGTVARDVIVLGRHEHKLAVARALGIRAMPTDPSMADRFDLVIDSTGRPEGLAHAIEFVRPRGTIVLKSTFHGELSTALWPVVVKEVTIIGSRCGPFAKAIALLEGGRIKTEPLISQVFALEDHAAAFAAARRELKILFDSSL